MCCAVACSTVCLFNKDCPIHWFPSQGSICDLRSSGSSCERWTIFDQTIWCALSQRLLCLFPIYFHMRTFVSKVACPPKEKLTYCYDNRHKHVYAIVRNRIRYKLNKNNVTPCTYGKCTIRVVYVRDVLVVGSEHNNMQSHAQYVTNMWEHVLCCTLR